MCNLLILQQVTQREAAQWSTARHCEKASTAHMTWAVDP
jgi:hypothetical protein